MRIRELVLLLAVSQLALPGCSTTASTTDTRDHQQLTIERWHRCIDNAYQRVSTETDSQRERAHVTMIVCRGHKEDVLATFPQRLEPALDNIMVKQIYDLGLQKAADIDLFETELKLDKLTTPSSS